MTWYEDLYNRQIYFDMYEESDTDLAASQTENVVKLLDLKPGQRVLDVCCGYGRHALELAQRGLEVTGVDLSAVQIARANERAASLGIEATFIESDARDMGFDEEFNATLSLFVSFGFDDDVQNLRMLRSIAQATEPGGLFLMDYINHEKEVRDFVPFSSEERPDGIRVDKSFEFNLWNGRLNWTNTVTQPDGGAESWNQSVRAYTLAELRNMYAEVGFELEAAYGDYDGGEYTLDSPQLITVARKVARS